MNNEQQKAVEAKRKCPHCGGSLTRYEDPLAVKMLADAQRELEQAQRERDEALESVRIHSNMLRVSVENVDAANKERDDLRAKLLASEAAVALLRMILEEWWPQKPVEWFNEPRFSEYKRQLEAVINGPCGQSFLAERERMPKCAHCGKPATCAGRYEDCEGPIEFACDECCGHGNEDGWCRQLSTFCGVLAERERHVKALENRPKIVVICGSSRFVQECAVKAWELNKQGIATFFMPTLPAWYPGVQEHHQAEAEGAAKNLDDLWLRLIDMADEVFVMNCEGYIGERTEIEIQHALKAGKPVNYEIARTALKHEP